MAGSREKGHFWVKNSKVRGWYGNFSTKKHFFFLKILNIVRSFVESIVSLADGTPASVVQRQMQGGLQSDQTRGVDHFMSTTNESIADLQQ
jgi:hypothetical protein